jgi:hypothetical protein
MASPLVRFGGKDIFERRESDNTSVRRSLLKLPSYRSVNPQRYIRASLNGGN